MQKLNLQTKNIVNQNIEVIKGFFPNVIIETKDSTGISTEMIDFDMLCQELSSFILDNNKEKYVLTWPGKKSSVINANSPILKTLRAIKDESKDFENTSNLYIQGDNLDAIKLLQESYLNKIKLVYIDPPYNTGRDFIYKDNFSHAITTELEESGQIDIDGNKLVKNQETNGRFHSDWLSMMYSRLKITRNLLKEDGVILISIDDNEVYNLRIICNEIFGESNFITSLIWRRRKTQANLTKNIAPVHDYIIAYAKNINKVEFNKLKYSDEFIEKTFKNPDNDPRGPYQTRPLAQPATSNNSEYTVILPNGRELTAKWSCSSETFKKYIDSNLLYIPNDGNGMPRLKIFLSESEGLLPNTWLDNEGTTENGSSEIKELFNGKQYFDFPKPTKLIKHLLSMTTTTNNNDLILDFFSGSSTTADAVMQLNAEDGGNRRFIMVQIPEETDEKSEAYKAGYKTICEIGKERIRRAGTKILEENKDKEGIENLDIGFRVFKVDSSNMKDVYYNPDEIRQDNLFDMVSNIKEDRTDLDLLFQVLLDSGVELTLPIEEKQIAGKKVYFVDGNVLAACFEDNLTEEFVTELAKCEDLLKVVFRDSSFGSDDSRINVEQIFKQYSPDTQIRVI